MKKALNITLNGIVFYIEEDAFNELKNYLDAIKDHFSGQDDSDEIINDIEASIAEKFSSKVTEKKQVITLIDVKNLIKVMGTVDDFAKTDSADEAQEKPKKVRKLYRDIDNAIIAGVAAGLGTYFGIDPIIFRLIFIGLVFAGGTGIWLYLIFWLVMPAAKTSGQKLEMLGSTVTLSEIEQTIKKKLKGKKVAQGVKTTLSAPVKAIRPLWKIVRGFVGIIIIVVTALTISFLTLGLVVILFNVGTSISDPVLDQVVTLPNFDFLAIGLYIAIFIPVIFVMLLGAWIVGGEKKVFKASSNAVLFGIWMIALIFTTVLIIDNIPKFQQIEDDVLGEVVTQNLNLKDFQKIAASHAVRLNIKADDEYYVSVSGREADLEQVTVKVKNDELQITREWQRLCIFCNLEPITFEITAPKLESLKLSGASRAEIQDFKSEDFSFDVDGASRLNADFFANNTDIDISGASRVTLKGSTQNLDALVSGASTLTAQDFTSATADINVSGASKAYINAVDELDVVAAGASKIYYSGNPQVQSNISGASKLENINIRTKVYNSDDIVAMSCETDSDCPMAMDYAIRSTCPYQSVCRDNQCAIVCPLWEHSPDQEESISYQVDCEIDSDCHCQEIWPGEYESCECINNACMAVVKE